MVPLSDKPVLMPGQFEWQPDLSPEGEVAITVNLSLQMLEVLRGGTLIARSTISSGRPGYSTPNGSYPIIEKDLTHYSNLYNNAPMHFMQRMTFQGLALHAGVLPGMPASHGCIRLPYHFARQLFKITSRGDVITVVGKASEYRPLSAKELKAMARTSKTPVSPVSKVLSQAGEETTQRDSTVPVIQKDKPSRQTSGAKQTMAQLESEELAIRGDIRLNPSERMKELKRVWAEQRALVGLP